jgi:methylase of polypeptide subunit release factors
VTDAVLTAPQATSSSSRLIAELRRRLVEVGFTDEGLRSAFGSGAAADPWSLATGQIASDDSPFSTLVRFFWSGTPVEERQLAAVLEPLRVSDLEELGLAEVRDGRAHPLALIRPHDGLLIVSGTGAADAGCVLGVVPAAETLAKLTIREPAACALDLGTGCGIQGLLLARHAGTVVATDINPRALAFAAFNAALNGMTGMQTRAGSWFDPVANDRFDVIAANPPFVISPDTAFTYRDGGLPRDTVCRMVVREAAAHLTEGGFATTLVNWIHDEGSWLEPVKAWVTDTGCDALLLRYATLGPADYAARWNLELRSSAPKAFDAAVRRWTDYYREQGITRIGFGAVILRRRSGADNWIRALDAATGPPTAASDHILRVFDAMDFLESCGDGLMSRAYALVHGHRVDQTLLYPDGKYLVGPAVFRLPGLGLEGHVDARALEVLLECDGSRTLGDLVSETASRQEVRTESVAALAEPAVRHLVERGFMIPAPSGPTT